MGLITGMLLFLGSAAAVGGKSIASTNAQLRAQTYHKQLGTNLQRQHDLEHLSWGNTEYDKQEFLRLLGEDNFRFEGATPAERQLAVWKIAQKEGWVYSKLSGCLDQLPPSCYGYKISEDKYINKLYRRF